MNLFEFMSDSPVLTFFLAFFLFGTIFRMWNRVIRHLNIRKAGWPPPHCDADGEFRKADEET